MKILFCDLDGTLIVTKSGNKFPKDCSDWKFKSGILKSLIRYKPDMIHIVTNQGGIQLHHVKLGDWLNKISEIMRQIKMYMDIPISYAMCPDNDKSNPSRKPNPKMVLDYIKEHDLDRNDCLMIGDASGLEGQFSDSDKKCAENAEISYMDVDEFIRVWSNVQS